MRQVSAAAPSGLSTRTSNRQLRHVKSSITSSSSQSTQLPQPQPQPHSSPSKRSHAPLQQPQHQQQQHSSQHRSQQQQPQQQQQQQQQQEMAPSTTIERLMRQSAEGQDVSAHLAELKRAILLDGIDSDEAGMSPHRVYIWLVLLRAPFTTYSTYAAYLARGASPSYSKINDDVHRTLATDPLFQRRVSQNSIARILNSIAWAMHDKARPTAPAPISLEDAAAIPLPIDDATTVDPFDPVYVASDPHQIPLPDSPGGGGGGGGSSNRSSSTRPSPYVQGMNVLAAPLLYVSRSEPQAFTLLQTLLTTELPSYVLPTMSGVHAGLELLERSLGVLDPALHAHLAAHALHASTYAFPSVATLSACTPPLPEVLRLWDFLFAYGVHLNVLAVAAQLVLMRDRLLGSESPGRELRRLEGLDARRVVEMVVVFVGRVGEGLYAEIVEHTHIK